MFVLYLLLLHSQVVIVFKVGIDDDLVEVTNNADMAIGLDIVVRPFLQF